MYSNASVNSSYLLIMNDLVMDPDLPQRVLAAALEVHKHLGPGLTLKTEMAEGESAAVIGPTRLPASRVASSYRCNRCEPESLVEPSKTPSSSLSIPVSRLNGSSEKLVQKAVSAGKWLDEPEFVISRVWGARRLRVS